MPWGKFGNSDACRVTRKSTQSSSNVLWTGVSFTAEDYDSAGMFAPTDTKITIKTAGIYGIVGEYLYASNSAGKRMVQVEKNAASAGTGTALAWHLLSPCTADDTRGTISWQGALAVADTVHLTLYQSSGGALNIGAASEDRLSLSVVRLRASV